MLTDALKWYVVPALALAAAAAIVLRLTSGISYTEADRWTR